MNASCFKPGVLHLTAKKYQLPLFLFFLSSMSGEVEKNAFVSAPGANGNRHSVRTWAPSARQDVCSNNASCCNEVRLGEWLGVSNIVEYTECPNKICHCYLQQHQASAQSLAFAICESVERLTSTTIDNSSRGIEPQNSHKANCESKVKRLEINIRDLMAG